MKHFRGMKQKCLRCRVKTNVSQTLPDLFGIVGIFVFPKIPTVPLGAGCCSSQCFSPVLLWVYLCSLQHCWKGSSASLFDSLQYVLSQISDTSQFLFSRVQQLTVCSVKLPENGSWKKVQWFLFMTLVSQQDNVWCRITNLRKEYSKDISISVSSDFSNGLSFSLPKLCC